MAICSAFSFSTVVSANEFNVENFPDLANWTISNSADQGFRNQKLSINYSGWEPAYTPISTDRTYQTNTLVYADESASFSRNNNYFFLSNSGSDVAFNLNDSTLRVLDECKNTSYQATLIRVDKKSSMHFSGSESSAIQMLGQGSRAIHVNSGTLAFETGDVWIQLKNDYPSQSYIVQISGSSSLTINADNDIVFLADLSESNGIAYGIQNSGDLSLDAKRIYFGISNAETTTTGENINQLVELNGTNSIGSDRTELIAFNGGRVGLHISANTSILNFKTQKLQIIGDNHEDSKGIKIDAAASEFMNFTVGDAYLSNVATGISLEYWSTAKMEFDNLSNLANQKAIDLRSAELDLTVNNTAYFDKDIKSDESYLTLLGGDFVVNESIRLSNESRLTGSANSLSTKQLVVEGDSFVDLGETSITIDAADTGLSAALSVSGSEVSLNKNKSQKSSIQIIKDISVANSSRVEANFVGNDSFFVGTTSNDSSDPLVDDSELNLSFADNAFWRVTGSTTQKANLNLTGTHVFMDEDADGQKSVLDSSNAITVSLSALSGEGGVFHMRTSVQDVYGDTLLIDQGEGSHQLFLTASGKEPSKEALDRALVTQTEGTLALSLANEGGKIDLGNYVYDLVNRDTEEETQWYLAPQTSPEPSQPTLSPSATAVLALAGSGAQTTQFLYSLSDLRKRMGEVRTGAADGLNISVRGGKDRISGFASTSFKNEYGAVSLGYDRKIDANWIVGASFEAVEGNQTVRNSDYRADGENSSQSLKGYATWFDDTGFYFDTAIGINRFDQDISTRMLDGQNVEGNYNSFGFGVSAEAGKTIWFGKPNTWFIEPQLQIAYYFIQGEDFSLTNGMQVKQDDANSLTGRLGAVLGRAFLQNDGTGYQIFAKAGINHEFLGDTDIIVNGDRFSDQMLGTRIYYGAGVDLFASDNLRIYGQIEREQGAQYTSEINARIGLKYHF